MIKDKSYRFTFIKFYYTMYLEGERKTFYLFANSVKITIQKGSIKMNLLERRTDLIKRLEEAEQSIKNYDSAIQKSKSQREEESLKKVRYNWNVTRLLIIKELEKVIK